METNSRCHSCGAPVKASTRRCPSCYVALEGATRAPSPLRAAPSAMPVATAAATPATLATTVPPAAAARPTGAGMKQVGMKQVGIRCPACETTVLPVAGWCPHCLDPLPVAVNANATASQAPPRAGWDLDNFEDFELFGADGPGGAPVAPIIARLWPDRSDGLALATWRQRAVASVIDAGAFMPSLAALAFSTGIALVLLVAAMAFTVWQTCFFQGRTGQTLGKRRVGIFLVDEVTRRPIGARRSLWRQLAHGIDGALLGLGYLWPLWNPRRQTFADQLAGTIVACT